MLRDVPADQLPPASRSIDYRERFSRRSPVSCSERQTRRHHQGELVPMGERGAEAADQLADEPNTASKR
jgi:hypothetical protein